MRAFAQINLSLLIAYFSSMLSGICDILLKLGGSGDNTEKIWAHRFFAKRKTDMPKARKMAAGSPGSPVVSQ